MEPIHKFNNGRGATLCHTCSVIITTGLTKDLYCEKCKPKQERSYSEEDMIEFGKFIFKNTLLVNVKGVEGILEQFKKK
jgi:hypothetical protein